jgi:hypothetical protein
LQEGNTEKTNMERALNAAAMVVVAGLINKYLVRRFWPATTTTAS